VFKKLVTFVTATTNNNTHVAWGRGPGRQLPLYWNLDQILSVGACSREPVFEPRYLGGVGPAQRRIIREISGTRYFQVLHRLIRSMPT
jgi:hypothetical protein